MSFLARILEPPSYGFTRDDRLYVPTHKEIFKEFGNRLNFFKCRKNWLTAVGWTATSALSIPFFIFLFNYFSWPLLILGLVYSMVILGSHGTFWLHRHSTHRAFQFRNPFWRFLFRNLVIKIVPEETYVISHHVHHKYSERPGDPYNVHAGWLYCFLADANHQAIARNLSEPDYQRLCRMLDHTGVNLNSYKSYQKWGSLCHPFYTICHFTLNWIFWYSAFYLMGGHALATALFGIAVIWGFGVRTFNYDGHGKGKDKKREGIDFNTKDLSINQVWPGYVAGEWHNNHHLFPNGARAGFLPYQVDLPWYLIYFGWKIGAISSFMDYKKDFLTHYYLPYKSRQMEFLRNRATQN